MNIRDLQYFLAIAELKHFGRAAEHCCVSQPTLSGQIKKLEEQLGIKLFERTNRCVMLTECGQQIATSARRVISEVDSIHQIARSYHSPFSGKFRLGAFPTLSTYVFPAIVPAIKIEMPDLRLILIEDKTAALIQKLRDGEIDAALLALPVDDSFLASRKLFDDAFYLAVPTGHPLTQYKVIEQDMLEHHRLLLLEEGHCLRDQSLEVCHLHGLQEDLDLRATGLETLRQMVKAGTGITFIPKVAIDRSDSDQGQGIVYIPFATPAPMRTIGLVWRKTTVREKVIVKTIDVMNALFAT